MADEAYPKESLPKPMDVVWCRFPYDEKPVTPPVVCHPGLVFATNEFRNGEYSVQVAYGTSSLKSESRPLDFIVMNAVNLCKAGLAQATRFDLDRIRYLPWTSRWFVRQNPNRHQTPVIGRLPVSEIEDLRELLRVRSAIGKPVP